MKILDFGSEYKEPIVIALGFFDCIHKGHRLLVDTANGYAKINGIKSALLTFSNDPAEFLGGAKQIYSFEERAHALDNLGLDVLLHTVFDKNFAALEPEEFLRVLFSRLSIKAIVVGGDYTFGKCAKGDVNLLKEYSVEHGADVIVKPFEEVNGSKISTSSLKTLVKNGDIASLNDLLSEYYFTIGSVIHARHVGSGLGFPTANIKASDTKYPLAAGVYATILQVDGKKYASMTNIGAKPTFGIENYGIETFILDFNEDIYEKTVKLSFVSRMRDVKKFKSAEALKDQLKYDESRIRELIKI